jgi:SAM-dependent methyltransferase
MRVAGAKRAGSDARPCVGCGATGWLPLIGFPGVPQSGIFLDDATGTLPRLDLNLVWCPGCGLARRSLVDGIGLDYAAIDRGTAQQMPDYADALVEALRTAGLREHSPVLEVGCNDGSFMIHLERRGFTRLTGIEPSRQLANVAAAKGLVVDVGYFTTASAGDLMRRHGRFGAVVCRHTLEHVPEPDDLLAAMTQLLEPGGLLLIEVPDFEWVLETLAVHEIWDEHISYFSATNLVSALGRLGLEVLSCERIRFRDTRNLVAMARLPVSPVSTTMPGVAFNGSRGPIEGCATLRQRWSALTRRLVDEARRWPRPVVAIGASHIQSNFIHFSGLADVVSALIDDDPRKAGRYVMLDAPRPILSTDQAIAELRSGTVLRTAFPYPGWMDWIATVLEPRGVLMVDPYATVETGDVRP